MARHTTGSRYYPGERIGKPLLVFRNFSFRQLNNPIRQLETRRTMGNENDGPMVKGIVAVFDE